MSHWNGTSESGILRKNYPSENHEELLVFGYACKLFRDDEKALYIDQGKHLIPWMGDEKLKIDRYDGRGALSDLLKYEASREGYDATRWLGLSEKDRNVEELCDKERYYSLIINEEEEQMYKEEEIKRKTTNAIQYNYDVPQNPELKQDEIPTVPEAEEEYIPPPVLDVPVDIEKPKTVKENARIEKTALFVCKQGPQMEILIKAKQSNNPQFGFLNQDNSLYKFYRHVLAAFKNGRYQGYEAHTKSNTENQMDPSDQDSGTHYLHPSLSSSSSSEPAAFTAITIPQIPYKPSVNCAYSQLVNRIQGNHPDAAPDADKVPDYSQMTYEQQQYYQYYYVQQYFEYYKQLTLFQQGQGGNPGQFNPPSDFRNLDPSLQHYIQQVAYNQYLKHHQQSNDNSYARIVSNVNKDSNPYAANVPQLPQTQPQQPPPPQAVEAASKPAADERTVTIVGGEKGDAAVGQPLLSLAAYGSGSEDEDEEEEEVRSVTVVTVPAGELRIVIDKLAAHVAKNGEQFEEILKSKNDPRFEFLNESNEFHNYYKQKLGELKGGAAENGTQTDESKSKTSDDGKENKKIKKEKKAIAPVCFSIKKPKDEPPKEIKSALPVEESDDEEEAPALNATVASLASQSPKTATENPKEAVQEPPEEVKIEKIESTEAETNDKTNVDDDPILEMIELTEETEDKKDAKRAEDKIKDKLAAAAREKLASVSRDRALQMERKKRAAAFLKLKTSHSDRQVELVGSGASDKSSPLRRASIEVIEIDSEDSSPKKKKHKRRRDGDRSRSRSRERDRDRRRERRKDKDRKKSFSSEEEENRRKEKRKKYKRDHSRGRHDSKSKRKSKKHRRRSESVSSDSADIVL